MSIHVFATAGCAEERQDRRPGLPHGSRQIHLPHICTSRCVNKSVESAVQDALIGLNSYPLHAQQVLQGVRCRAVCVGSETASRRDGKGGMAWTSAHYMRHFTPPSATCPPPSASPTSLSSCLPPPVLPHNLPPSLSCLPPLFQPPHATSLTPPPLCRIKQSS